MILTLERGCSPDAGFRLFYERVLDGSDRVKLGLFNRLYIMKINKQRKWVEIFFGTCPGEHPISDVFLIFMKAKWVETFFKTCHGENPLSEIFFIFKNILDSATFWKYSYFGFKKFLDSNGQEIFLNTYVGPLLRCLRVATEKGVFFYKHINFKWSLRSLS